MDNINSVGDFIRTAFSALVNKDDVIFKALLADPDKGSPGTVEKIFLDMEEVRDKWCNTSNVYEQTGEMLEKTLALFSVLEPYHGESERSWKERNRLLYARNKDTLWGDVWNILRLFRKYFNTEWVYIVNNTNDIDENLLSDGDFEYQDGSWVLESCEYSQDACFSERYGVKFDGDGKCSQNVNVEQEEVYFLHFFLIGNIDVAVTDNMGRYWKPAGPHLDEFGSWGSAPHKIRINAKDSEKWEAKSIFFINDSNVFTVNISFLGIEGEVASLDYIRLFKKEAYPSFTLIAVFIGRFSPETLGMAPGKDDPIVARDYGGYKHFSGGKDDADDADYDKLSFFDKSAINEDKDPVLAEGENDKGEIAPSNDGYFEGTPLAPWKNDKPGFTVDYSKMSYIEQSHLLGADGVLREDIYTELLEIVRAGGIVSSIDILIRELDEGQEG